MTTNGDHIREDAIDAGTSAADGQGFVHAVTPHAARRQLRVSLALAGVIALATIAVAASTTIQPRHTQQASVKLTVEAPGSLHVQQARVKRVPNGG